MSKIYDIYKTLKNNNNYSNTLFLFRTGIFFIFVDKDARIASNILGLKIGKLNEEIIKCGFPVSSLEKYSKLLKYSNYNLEIVNTEDFSVHSYNDYIYSDKLKNIITQIITLDIDSLSISQTYDYLYNLQKELKDLSN